MLDERFNGEEIIIKKNDLLLAIQRGIMYAEEDLNETKDIGYTSWIVANLIVNELLKEKLKKKQGKVNKLLNFLLDKKNTKL
jgi:hypothetical protein